MGKKKSAPVTSNARPVDEDGFEILGGDQSPLAVGEVVMGVFGGVVRHLPAKKKGQAPLPVYRVGTRELLGNTVLRDRIEKGEVKEGDTLKVTRLEDAPAKKGQNPAKMFAVGVKRAS